MVFKLIGGEPTPYAVFLPRSGRIVGTQFPNRTLVANGFGGFDGFVSNVCVGNVFREEHFGQVLTRNAANSFDGEQQFRMRVSVVQHMVSSVGGNCGG